MIAHVSTKPQRQPFDTQKSARPLGQIEGELREALGAETANIVRIGNLLIEAKRQVRHGHWGNWLGEKFSLSDRTAQKCMKAAKFVDKYELDSYLNLSPSVLYLLSEDAGWRGQAEIRKKATEEILRASRAKRVDIEHAEKIIEDVRQKVLARADQCGTTEPVPERQPVVLAGERWLLGPHVLQCGDATRPEDVQRLLGEGRPHLMVTSPPYGVNFDAAWRARVVGRNHQPRGVPNDDRADWRAAYALFLGDVAYVYHSYLNDEIINDLEAVGFQRRDHIVAVKENFVLGRGHYQSQYDPCWYVVKHGRDPHWAGGRDKSNAWPIKRNSDSDGRDDRTIHGAQKRVDHMLIPILNSSLPGDAVYEPFCGSGTTIVAAEIAGRRCYGMEIDPVYCTIAIERWQRFGGKKATLESTGQTFDEVKRQREVQPDISIPVAKKAA